MNRWEMDYLTTCRVSRDICYLYHELAQYNSFMGDLDYNELLTLPYWEFLDLNDTPVEELPEEEQLFIREGCLVMTLNELWGDIDGAIGFRRTDLLPCRMLVERVIRETERMDRLLTAVLLALDIVEGKSKDEERLSSLSREIYDEIVRGYFAENARTPREP